MIIFRTYVKQFKKFSSRIFFGNWSKIFLFQFIIILLSIQVAYGQESNVNLEMKNVSIKQVLKRIEQQSDFIFTYNSKLIDVDEAIDVAFRNTALLDALEEIFKNQEVNFVFNDQLIIITKNISDEVIPPSERVITGTVSDKNGNPLPGATIVAKNTQVGVSSDINGAYSIAIPPDVDVLVYSFIGMEAREVAIADRVEINIVLQDEVTSLEEIVVVGYGTQKKVTVTGSVAAISGAEILETKAANLANSLTGRVPGLVINSRGGEPGADNAQVLIRGIGTTGDNSPLYVIDGIANRGSFERLNPDDIESISVLKDASASIYGAQAANGVILITTKRGATGEPRFTYSSTYSISQPTRRPHLSNALQYLTWIDEQNERNGRPTEYKDIIREYREGTNDPAKWADTDWWAEVMDVWTPQQQQNISLTGGSEKVKYYLSGQYLDQDATYIGKAFGYKQYNVRSNIDAQVSKHLKIGFDLSGRRGEKTGATQSTDALIRQVFVQAPFESPYYPNGLVVKTSNGNPINFVNGNSGSINTRNNFIDTKFSFQLDMPFITEGLYVSGYGALDYYTTFQKKLTRPYDQYLLNEATGEYVNYVDQTGTATLWQESREELNRTLHLRVGYERTFDSHTVNLFAAYEQYTHHGEFFNAYRRDLVTPDLPYLFAGSDEGQNNSGMGFQSARKNYFGRINYNYQEKYLLEFTLRYDGSENFQEEKRYGLFPGVSLGWRLTEEPFFSSDLLSSLKIRASWGQLGNDKVPNFQYLQFYNLSYSHIFGEDKLRTLGLTPGTTPNPNITWETAEKSNIGVDFAFRKYLRGTIEFFHTKRSDILTPRNASIPVYTGMTLPDENIGQVKNQGVELDLRHHNNISAINYSIGGQVTFAKSEILFIDEADNIPDYQRRTGNPIDYILIYEADGLYQDQDEIDASAHFADAKPGDVKFIDKSGDGKIDADDKIILENSPTPKLVYGIPLDVNWKNLSLNIFIQGQAMAQTIYRPWDINQQSVYFEERWISKRLTPDAIYPAAYDMSSSSIQNESTIWVKDNSFLRFKNIQLSYNFTDKLLERISLSSMSVYVSGHNLFFIYDKVKFNDPESTSKTGWYYPQQRLLSAGLSVTF
jgi:TonB-dependent starch-binding outer membrane protein SusC